MESNVHPGTNIAMFAHSVQTQANAVKFAHQSLCNPKISTLLKATRQGFLKGVPKYFQKTYSQASQPKFCHSKETHETPLTWHQEYKPQASQDNPLACPNHICCTTTASSSNTAPCFTSLPRGTYVSWPHIWHNNMSQPDWK
jgi:hypothetical protein